MGPGRITHSSSFVRTKASLSLSLSLSHTHTHTLHGKNQASFNLASSQPGDDEVPPPIHKVTNAAKLVPFREEAPAARPGTGTQHPALLLCSGGSWGGKEPAAA
ncbi:UNVERIFIED_CONTAM: hypothetical protein K2H54_002841 [Gekko kuhli]